MAKAELLVPKLLRWEGGFVNDPDDAGGATNKGVTIATFRKFYGESATIEQLKRITDEQWLHIFKVGYWDKFRADDIKDQSIANMCVDWLYNSGIAAIKRVQKIVGVEDDGVVGSKTITAINARKASPLFYQIRAARIAFVETIAKNKPSQRKFLQGWKNRILSFEYDETSN